MNALTRAEVQLRAAVSRRAGRWPAWVRSRLGRVDGPARIDLRLDDIDGGALLAQRPLGEWQSRILDLFMAHGPLPLTVIALPTNVLLAEVVRFCHRLDAPVTVRTVGAGLDDRAAGWIIDGGARRVVVATPTAGALEALVRVRVSRRAKVDVEAAVGPETALVEAKALMAAGADGVRVEPAWRGAPSGPWPLQDVVASFHRTDPAVWRALDAMVGPTSSPPGHARAGGHCGIGSRIVLDEAGVRSCPWKDGAVDRKGAWADLAAHRAAIAACDRVCWHVEAR